MGKGSTLCQKCEEFMENKNSCKENFEMVKTELQDMEAIADFFSNPMIKSGMEMLGEIPGIGSLAKNLLEQEVAGFQKRKREEFLSYITESGELIAKSDVADVPFLMELARTLEVLNRLATNEKVLYIANLFKHTFLLAGDRDIDLYEENLKRLEELSIREITILAKLHQYKYNNEAFYEDIRKDCGIEKDEVKNILSAVTRTGFCKEKVGTYLGYEGDVYYTTSLFESFLKCIGVCAEETESERDG